MPKYKKIVLFCLIFILYGCSEQKLIFDKKTWDDKDTIFINQERYNMFLWLQENYNFCDKNFDQIFEKFGEWDDPRRAPLGGSSTFGYVIKQKNDKGIDPPYDIAYLYFDFDKSNNNILKVYVSERKNKENDYVTSIICTR